MGLKDRPYWREDQGAGGGGIGRAVTVGMPKPGRAVKYLLIINVAVFLLQLIFLAAKVQLSAYFGATVSGWWQIWRYVTFQFLHSPYSLWHLGLNMLGLYMLGTPLETHWGTKSFVRFYLICGIVAGIAYVVMAAIMGLPRTFPLIGASGGVYGILLACAVLFPHFRLILFLFPLPIRMAAVIIFGGMILIVFSSLSAGQVGPEFWSHVAHLGGVAAAAFWIWVLPSVKGGIARSREERAAGAWQRKMAKRRAEQEQIDRILDKVKQHGLNSLSRREKEKLRRATLRQRAEENRFFSP